MQENGKSQRPKKSSDKFKDWEVGKGYKCEKLLGKGSYG